MSDDQRRRDYPLADELDANTPERLKALGDPLRALICDLVLERAMSVTELAARTGRPRGTVAYHVDVLVDAGLVDVVRTRRVRAIEERFYGRTARTYVLPGTPGELPFLRDVLTDADIAALAHDSTPGTFTFRHARIPTHRVEDYCRRLDELAIDFVDEPRDGDVEFGLYLALFPTVRARHGTDATEEQP